MYGTQYAISPFGACLCPDGSIEGSREKNRCTWCGDFGVPWCEPELSVNVSDAPTSLIASHSWISPARISGEKRTTFKMTGAVHKGGYVLFMAVG